MRQLIRNHLRSATVALLIWSACPAAAAAPVGPPNPESPRSIAERNLPGKQAELARVDDVSAWVPGAVAAFYTQPVGYDTPSPQDRDLVGYLLVPVQGRPLQRVLIDSYGPEGANADVIAVTFRTLRGTSDRVLVVRVMWQNAHSVQSQECSYLKPSLPSLPPRLTKVKNEKCPFGG